jgi:hypothetical protein
MRDLWQQIRLLHWCDWKSGWVVSRTKLFPDLVFWKTHFVTQFYLERCAGKLACGE